jgi:hypothetical protein
MDSGGQFPMGCAHNFDVEASLEHSAQMNHWVLSASDCESSPDVL